MRRSGTARAQVAAYCTLFQGMLALPMALVLTAVGPGAPRPSMPGMDSLSILLSVGQLLALPVVGYLVVTGRFTLVPLAMTIALVVHFAPYSWLYGTPLYLVMGGTLSVAAALAMATGARGVSRTEGEVSGAGRVCLVSGVVMLACSAIALLL